MRLLTPEKIRRGGLTYIGAPPQEDKNDIIKYGKGLEMGSQPMNKGQK